MLGMLEWHVRHSSMAQPFQKHTLAIGCLIMQLTTLIVHHARWVVILPPRAAKATIVMCVTPSKHELTNEVS